MLIHNADITGSLTINGIPFNTGSFSGSFTGAVAGTTSTASYVEYNNVANKPALVSGSSQITYSGLTGIPSGIVSGSSQVTYSGLTGIPSGIVSGSAQVAGLGYATTSSNTFIGNQTITGSVFGSGSLTIDGCITATGQIVAQTINVQQVTSSIVYSCGSNIFGNSLSNTQQFTGSVGVTGSLTINGTSAVVGSGTTNYVPKFTAGSTIENSIIQEVSSNIGIGVNPSRKLHVLGGAGTAQIQSSGASSIMYFGDACSSVIDNQGFGSVGNSLFLLTGGSERLFLNCSGNLGLGVTPSAWSVIQAMQVLNTSWGASPNNLILYQSSNVFYDGAFKYITTGTASQYRINDSGVFSWLQAPSGTAGCTISFTQAMTLNASGNLGIGVTDPDIFGRGDQRNVGISVVGASDNTALQINAGGSAGRGAQIYMGQGACRHFTISSNVTESTVGTSTATPLRIVTNELERMRITSTGIACFACQVCAPAAIFSGCVGIGTTSPDTLLTIDTQVANFSTGTLARLYASKGTTEGAYLQIQATRHSTQSVRRVELYAYEGASCNANLVLQPNGGCAGVGTYVPGTTLEVRGTGNQALNSKGNLFVADGGTATQTAGEGGQLSFGAWLNGDLSSPYPLAVIKGISECSTTNLNNGALIFGTMDSNTTVQERMRITSGGSVGIGNNTPSRLLSLYATIPVLQFTNPTTGVTSNDGTQFFQNAENFTLELQDGGYFNILTGGSERMRITSTGIACFACQVCAPSIITNDIRLNCSTGLHQIYGARNLSLNTTTYYDTTIGQAGMLIVNSGIDRAGVFVISAPGAGNSAISKIGDPSSYYSTTCNNASTVNFFFSGGSGNLIMQNCTGSTRSFSLTLIGTP